MRDTRRRPWRELAGVAVGLCLAGVTTAELLRPAAAQDVGVVPVAAAPMTERLPPRPVAASVRVVDPGTEPARLRIPRLGVDAPVGGVDVLADGQLDVPNNAGTLGWWSGSARPGQPGGSTVIDGHVDTVRQGRGAFFALSTLVPGDPVEVVGRDGRVLRYTVSARRQYPKSALPVTEVFGPTPQPRLVLVTCGGSFDSRRRHYADNVVVYAVPRT